MTEKDGSPFAFEIKHPLRNFVISLIFLCLILGLINNNLFVGILLGCASFLSLIALVIFLFIGFYTVDFILKKLRMVINNVEK